MKTTIEFLDEIARRHADERGEPASDYRLSKILGVSKQAVSKYRNSETHLSETVAEKVAEELSLPPEYVLNCVAAERSKNPTVKAALWRAAERLAACILIGVGLTGAPAPAEASTSQQFNNNQAGIQIMRNLMLNRGIA